MTEPGTSAIVIAKDSDAAEQRYVVAVGVDNQWNVVDTARSSSPVMATSSADEIAKAIAGLMNGDLVEAQRRLLRFTDGHEESVRD